LTCNHLDKHLVICVYRYVSAVSLPEQGQEFAGGTPSVVSGWGAYDEGLNSPAALHKVDTQG
jgi:hypothetical protein